MQDWLAWASEDLSAWTQRVLDSLTESVTTMDSIGATDCEVYVPDTPPGTPPQRNWVPIRTLPVLPKGWRMCRPPASKSAPYDRPMYIGVLRDGGGQVAFQKLVLVPADVRLRLMFGFDQLKGVRRKIGIEQRGAICRTRIPFRLPEPESRVLDLGWPAADGFVEFSAYLLPFLLEIMDRLHVDTELTRCPENEE